MWSVTGRTVNTLTRRVSALADAQSSVLKVCYTLRATPNRSRMHATWLIPDQEEQSCDEGARPRRYDASAAGLSLSTTCTTPPMHAIKQAVCPLAWPAATTAEGAPRKTQAAQLACRLPLLLPSCKRCTDTQQQRTGEASRAHTRKHIASGSKQRKAAPQVVGNCS